MPKKVDSAEQRRSLAVAAVAVIAERGLEGARLRDIARAAGVTTGAVTHYFDGKEAILQAALEGMVGRLLESLDILDARDMRDARSAAPRRDSSRGIAARFARRYLSYLPTDPARQAEWRVWIAYWGRAAAHDSDAAARLRTIHQRHYRALGDRLATALGRLRPAGVPAPLTERRAVADACIAAIDGVGTRATLEPESWPATRQRDTLERLLLPLLVAFVEVETESTETESSETERSETGDSA